MLTPQNGWQVCESGAQAPSRVFLQILKTSPVSMGLSVSLQACSPLVTSIHANRIMAKYKMALTDCEIFPSNNIFTKDQLPDLDLPFQRKKLLR